MDRDRLGVFTLGFAALAACGAREPLIGTTPGMVGTVGTTSGPTHPREMAVRITWTPVTVTGTSPGTSYTPPTWCGDTVDIEVTDGRAATWRFGMVDVDGWTGESCLAAADSGLREPICHEIAPAATLTQVLDCDPASAVAGVTTGFGADDAPFLTYVLEDGATGQCWVWGADPAYYDGLGCEAFTNLL